MGERSDTCATVESSLPGFQVQFAIFGQTDEVQFDIFPLGNDLPGHKVGVVLHDGEHNFVSLGKAVREAMGNEIDAFGSAANKDEFVRTRQA